MADIPAVLSFIPWLRRGLATGITRPDSGFAGTPGNPIGVNIQLNDNNSATTSIELVEPGDIVGLDGRTVARTFPKSNEQDAEFRHLAMVEFDQADLPWRYTPAAAAGQKLRPWMTLLVLVDPDEVSVTPASPSQKLAVASMSKSVLPDLSEAWGWGHVQVHGVTSAATISNTLSGSPGQFVARLMSTRVLTPKTSYRAMLVPTFMRGRMVGLGQDPGQTDALQLAWENGSPDPIVLPVYYQWSFTTGEVGSFEDLVRALTPRLLSESVGRRPMDVRVPGLGLPTASSTPLSVEGALQSLAAAAAGPSPWLATERANFTTALASVLNFSTATLADVGIQRVVVPPLYGRWHAAQPRLQQNSNPPWFFELNDDPRLRVAAASGTSVVQAHDQELMASAWQQVGSLKDINAERRVLQTGREAFTLGFNRHARSGNRGSFFFLMERLFSRVKIGAVTTLSLFSGSRIGLGVLDPAWRRLARPRGGLGRRQGRAGLPNSAISDFLDRLNDGRLTPTSEPGTPGGMATWSNTCGVLVPGGLPTTRIPTLSSLGRDPLVFWGLLFFCVARKQLLATSAPGRKWWWLLRMMRFGLALIRLAQSQAAILRLARLRDGKLTVADVKAPPGAPTFKAVDTIPASPALPTVPPVGAVDSQDATAFRNALSDLLGLLGAPRPPRPVGATLDLGAIFNALTGALHPNVTMIESMAKRLHLDPSVFWQASDPLEPIMPAPEFKQPMYEPLRDLSQEWIVPGLAEVKPDTVALLLTNQRFIEAYMVGLSFEMGRELLWNEYPTDQRGTYFRQFWDHRGYVPAPGETFDPEVFRDIKPIHGWPKTAALGANSARRPPPGGQHLVLLVRGELIHRYPNVIVYAAQTTNIDAPERHPVFSGRIGSDVAFYGFEITQSEASGNPGWYFVLQEQPAEPRFRPPDASQGFLYVTAAAAADATTHAVPVTAAEMASNLLQQRTRVAVHGSALVPNP
jgi:hypothetical protein